MENYLKPKEYYENLYDQHTVDMCRETEARMFQLKDNKDNKSKYKESMFGPILCNLVLHFKTGERYLNRQETIRKWIDDDRAKEELLENAVLPNNIYCNKCGDMMLVEDKLLHGKSIEEKERVLFLFRCPSRCGRGRAVFHDGEEWIIKPELCDKCGLELNKKVERKGNIILTYYSCKKCRFKKVDKLDLSVRKEEKKKIDKFYNRDRAKFCLNEEQGQKYYKGKMNIKRFEKLMEDIKKRNDNKEVYKKVFKLKKLTISELEKKLVPVLTNEGYIKFELDKPEIGRDVFIEFSAQDEKSDREEYDSSNNIKKIIKKTLENTNWRLMSEGIHYRLGFLNGRLRGYEKEEDLVNLVEKILSKKNE